MVERDAVNKFVDFGQILNVRVFSFPAGVAFIQLSKHIHKLMKQHCKKEGGMQRVTSILSEDVGLGEILGLARECFVSSVQPPPKS